MSTMDFVNVKNIESISDDAIYYLFHYHKKDEYGVQDRISLDILDFKNIGNKPPGFNFDETEKKLLDIFAGVFSKYFVNKLPMRTSDYVFCLVPSHKSNTDNKNSIYFMSRWNKLIRDYFNKSVIIRTETINKLSMGGNRDISVHLNSLKINTDVKGKRIVVIDDVTTTGNSLIASKLLLEKAGAKQVLLFAFAKTSYVYK